MCTLHQLPTARQSERVRVLRHYDMFKVPKVSDAAACAACVWVRGGFGPAVGAAHLQHRPAPDGQTCLYHALRTRDPEKFVSSSGSCSNLWRNLGCRETYAAFFLCLSDAPLCQERSRLSCLSTAGFSMTDLSTSRQAGLQVLDVATPPKW